MSYKRKNKKSTYGGVFISSFKFNKEMDKKISKEVRKQLKKRRKR